jgi:ACS family tartrate transporter-like MFS transporter
MSILEPAIVTPAPHPSPEADAVGREAVRKASWRLLPLLALGYGTAYMDRVNISFASLQMNRDLHFSASVYGFGAGLFFLSYAVCEIPSNLLLLRFGARRWLARIMLTWGALAIGMMFVRTPLEFYVMRFLLGVAEAGFFPGVLFYLMQWFPPGARARAVSRFYVSLPLSSVVMGSIAGALLGLQGHFGLAGWQWLFLVEGLPAIALSVIFLRCLPDTPAQAPWLSQAERQALLTAIVAAGGIETAHAPHHPLQALKEPRVWLIGVLFLSMLSCNYAFAFSAPVILQKLTGFATARVGLLIAIGGLLGGAAMLGNAAHSDRSGERYWHVIVPFVLIAAGFVLGGTTLRPWLAVPALLLTMVANSALQGPLLATPGDFLKGSTAAAGFAAMNMIGMFGGFLGPYWMGVARDLSGNYQRGLVTLAVPALLAAGIILQLSAYPRSMNSR